MKTLTLNKNKNTNKTTNNSSRQELEGILKEAFSVDNMDKAWKSVKDKYFEPLGTPQEIKNAKK